METLLKSFGIEGSLLLWQVINFAVLFGALSYFFYKPVKRLMNEREKKIRESLSEAEELRKKSETIEKEFRAKMTAQRVEIEEFHQKALIEQERLKKELKNKAVEEAERIITEARTLASEEKNALLKSVEDEIKEIALALAGKILEREIDEKNQKRMIDEALKSLKKS